ncbi:protein phosphatase 2C domain-containing protein [Pseudomonas fildesensis]|uniref:Serine/threonine protein phosphatase n=1 Tax=Pseudomonas fildesensis TaxID=1674920 RepID=A0A0J8G1F1_9PSED|nr:protein phosphatase 2C domain-containing protein [Pseudomonas fildesensis]KMT54844.1 serine/threonine protein phosphatase [Pseudomonas fildesensis]
MILPLSLSRKGTHRTENRDASGSAHNTGTYLYVIADGTSKPGSGELAQALTHSLLESFSRAAPPVVSCPDKALELTLSSLDEVHSNLCRDYPLASTSYLALLVIDQTALCIHAGDCCLGQLGKARRVNWLSSPHCGPNWKGDLGHSLIAKSPARKRLLNCMSHRRPHEPYVQPMHFAPGTTLILATDGFWAELCVERQLSAIAERSLDAYPAEDDVTFMLFQT